MSVDSLVEQILEETKSYYPSEEVAECIGNTVLVALIGPVAVGKTTAMREIEKLSSDFAMTRGFTTRPQRRGEMSDTYSFLPHTEEVLEGIINSIRRRELAEVVVHPSTGYVYGTDTSDYTHRYSLLDTLASSVEEIHKLPFARIIEIGLVTTPEDWLRRISARSDSKDLKDPDNNKRIVEGVFSLRWLLSQVPEIPIVMNRDGDMARTVDEIISIAQGRRYAEDPNKRKGAKLLLKFFQENLKETF